LIDRFHTFCHFNSSRVKFKLSCTTKHQCMHNI